MAAKIKSLEKQIRRKEIKRVRVGSVLDASSVLWNIGVEHPILVHRSRQNSAEKFFVREKVNFANSDKSKESRKDS